MRLKGLAAVRVVALSGVALSGVALSVVALCAAGCATTQTTSARSVTVSSEPVASHAAGRQAASSELPSSGLPSSGPASSQAAGAVSSGPASAGPASAGPASAGPASSGAPSAAASALNGSLDAAVEKRLWELAVSAATAEGSTVKEAQAVRSTHAHAVAVTMGDGVEDDQPVWVVQLEGVGEFVCNQCSVPQGGAQPRGRYQVLIVGASTLQGMDFGLSNTNVDLAQLGPVVELHR